ncbi:5-formyltetrahydrofolate cyclo-ligase [Diaphorina citri]|uniref:5-formyltetrahydrofolate cyclo-ligase n=1 Tax=Diaphorina citri TaxID=121845 RepID=A0A3Q0IZ18_DIACI|nr:5-formyltetrahydrofolate cyclo-ligase [Diaphorina citri]
MTMLKLHRYEDLDNLIKNKENILQHSQTEPTEDAMKTGGLDLVVVPGRAFTETGKRCTVSFSWPYIGCLGFQFLKHPVYEQSKRISIYVDRDDEISTRKIIQHICSSGKECFIPRYDKTEMTMLVLHRYEDLDNLIKNKENILQHSQTEPTEDAMKTGGLDLVVVPGRAFTETGKRMGRGKGYYDTYLSELKRISPHCKTIGLAFSCQMVEDLPMSDHDVPLDYVIHPLSTP